MNTKKALASVLITTACSTGTAGPAMPKPRVARGEVGAPPAIACSPSAHYEAERGCTEDLYGVPLRVTHQNAMTSSFRLVGVALALDGDLVFDSNDPALLERKAFPVLTTSVRSGHHDLGVLLVYRGHGYGVFAYLKGYKFEARANHAFEAHGDRGVNVRVVGYEKGSPTTPVEERPAVRFE